ncbi:MAG: hypothetical protein QNI87_10135 [Erythrobacter sp.]|uniref:hypothetical protein n=1 Tax=Erythrobacter sp. TaxID=1042 RepID=UPI0026326E90|nr:hypothetical protein [Erythrobacter sp.]MDJ0978886.1 hypothetical protein [Erythrobacter sp.]
MRFCCFSWPRFCAGSRIKSIAYHPGYSDTALQFKGPTGPFDARGPVGDAIIDDRARNEVTARRLWEMSEELVGEKLAV